MLIDYRRDPRALERLRNGPSGPFLDDFVRHLESEGAATKTIRNQVGIVDHFCRWAADFGLLELSDLDEGAWRQLETHAASCRCFGRPLSSSSRFLKGTRRFLEFARGLGVVIPALPLRIGPPLLLQEFADWATRQRGLRPATIENYSRSVRELLAVLGEEPQRYEIAGLRTFLLDYQQRHGRWCAQHAVTALRSFVRFLSATRRCSPSLAEAIPPVVAWKLSSLPRYLPAEEIERVIAACTGAAVVDLRDRAVLLLLARLGLRAGDVARLRLGDIDWEGGTLQFVGKGRREVRLPLTQEIGEAIAAYVERGRPRVRFEEVFLITTPPVRPLTSHRVSGVAGKFIRRAGVRAPSHGAHVLRHSAATELLRQGASLDEIGALLRHRFRDTTAIYAKVDVALLKLVAQPWPEVTSC
jgi:site-specific recombinase XerD